MASQPTTPNTQPSPDTTIGELRKQYGRHFAEGYGDQDKLGQVLARAGVSTIDEYIQQGERSRTGGGTTPR